jgi:hypothetical protein
LIPLLGKIIQRWSSLSTHIDKTDYSKTGKYEKTCLQASKLLEKPAVQKWVSNTYPIIIIDEVQDLTKSRFGILKGLSEYTTLLVAGDEFQNLDDNNDSSDYIEWLKDNSSYQLLNTHYRTNDEGLLSVAKEIRNGNGFIDFLQKNTFSHDLGNFKLYTCPTWQNMAWVIGFRLFQLVNSDVAILTLANSEKIVEDALQKVKNKPQNLNKKRGTTFGPFKGLSRSKKDEEYAEELISTICDSDDTCLVEELLTKSDNIKDIGIRETFQKYIKRRRKLGYNEIKAAELKDIILNLVRNRRVFGRLNKIKRQILTVHQAKNREFDNVIVLWSFGIGSKVSIDYKRKLLYNAITRAKHSCTVIVLQEKRIKEPPFMN